MCTKHEFKKKITPDKYIIPWPTDGKTILVKQGLEIKSAVQLSTVYYSLLH